jgi:hypothetical protein
LAAISIKPATWQLVARKSAPLVNVASFFTMASFDGARRLLSIDDLL